MSTEISTGAAFLVVIDGVLDLDPFLLCRQSRGRDFSNVSTSKFKIYNKGGVIHKLLLQKPVWVDGSRNPKNLSVRTKYVV